MIDLTKSQAELTGPAETLEELFDRLSSRIDRVIRLKARDYDYGYRGVLVSGTLEAVQYIVSERSFTVYLSSSAAVKTPLQYSISLDSELSLLTDGQWVPIHMPKGRN